MKCFIVRETLDLRCSRFLHHLAMVKDTDEARAIGFPKAKDFTQNYKS